MRPAKKIANFSVALVLACTTQGCDNPFKSSNSDGLPSSPERCAMLVSAAYSNAILHENSKSLAHLQAFTANCKQYPMPYGWRMEAARVRRLLDGENANDIYPSANNGTRK